MVATAAEGEVQMEESEARRTCIVEARTIVAIWRDQSAGQESGEIKGLYASSLRVGAAW